MLNVAFCIAVSYRLQLKQFLWMEFEANSSLRKKYPIISRGRKCNEFIKSMFTDE